MFCKCTIKTQNQKGATIVEFALILPLLLLLLFGIIEFGLYLFNKQVITNATREGARAGIVSRLVRMSNEDIGGVGGVVRGYCEQHLVTFGSDKTVSVTLKDPVPFKKDITDPVTQRCVEFGCILEVQVDFNYEFLFLKTIGINSKNIRSVAQMRME